MVYKTTLTNTDRYEYNYCNQVKGLIRDLRSFEIRFEFESAVPIRFESDGPIRKFSNRPCVPIARRSQTTQTINGTVYRLASYEWSYATIV